MMYTVNVRLKAINPESVEKALETIPPKRLITIAIRIFDALSDPTRMKILYAIRRQKLSVRDIAIVIGISESAVSHQMAYLRKKRLVKSLREGKIIYYEVAYKHLSALLKEAEYYADHIKSKIPDHPYNEQ